ncbi:hypothetical protein LJC31_03380 [Synergistaceae bacterium OttesenSCG-928-I11]|nr:hypothetical protein [Synergistaceae bacterium OttesenSCG-928-I11]
MYKAGTAVEVLNLRGKLPKEVYLNALRLATILDGHYGEGRDVDNDDGGIILFVERSDDLDEIGRRYMRLDENRHESVHFVVCEGEDYVDVLFLTHNDFGINVFIPVSLAPETLLQEARRNPRMT